MSFPSPLVPIGAIARAHGVGGVVRVRLYEACSGVLAGSGRVFVTREGAEPGVAFRVERASRDKDAYLLKLEGVDDREAAEALHGAEVRLPRAELPAPADDEVYVADLVGCDLVDRAGRLLGRVARVDNYGAQELLIVDRCGPPASTPTTAGDRLRGGAQAMVPFVEPLIVSVDLEARRIACDLPEGLLDVEMEGGGAGARARGPGAAAGPPGGAGGDGEGAP